uniref:CSON001164 protein n=1 Tax=Culicoides sonorensis TaxID=179676 RepID=A0A336L6Y0_CULSO
MSITNNGHTVQLTVNVENMPIVSGGPLTGPYQFAQLHFHWGDNDTYGSEDLIEGHSFPMELHAVFYKMEYGSVKSAMSHEDGLTVLAFFFEISDDDNENYMEFTELLDQIVEPRTSAVFTKQPSFGELFATDFTHYYTYNGSLTTPPCSEIVTWIDFAHPIYLSHNQPLGDRIIWFNVLPEEEGKDIDLSKPHTHDIEVDEDEINKNEIEKKGMRPAYRKEIDENPPKTDEDGKGQGHQISLGSSLLFLVGFLLFNTLS